MKKLITYFLLLVLLGCAHPEPIATPEEVNDYLIKITERSNIDLLNRMNNDNVII